MKPLPRRQPALQLVSRQAAPAISEQVRQQPRIVLLRTREAMAFLKFDGPHGMKAFFNWADRYNVPRLHRGRTVLWDRRVLIDFLEGAAWTKRRA